MRVNGHGIKGSQCRRDQAYEVTNMGRAAAPGRPRPPPETGLAQAGPIGDRGAAPPAQTRSMFADASSRHAPGGPRVACAPLTPLPLRLEPPRSPKCTGLTRRRRPGIRACAQRNKARPGRSGQLAVVDGAVDNPRMGLHGARSSVSAPSRVEQCSPPPRRLHSVGGTRAPPSRRAANVWADRRRAVAWPVPVALEPCH